MQRVFHEMQDGALHEAVGGQQWGYSDGKGRPGSTFHAMLRSQEFMVKVRGSQAMLHWRRTNMYRSSQASRRRRQRGQQIRSNEYNGPNKQ